MSGSEQNIFVEKLQKTYFGFDLGVGPVVAGLKDSASHTHVAEVVCLSLPVELMISVEKNIPDPLHFPSLLVVQSHSLA